MIVSITIQSFSIGEAVACLINDRMFREEGVRQEDVPGRDRDDPSRFTFLRGITGSGREVEFFAPEGQTEGTLQAKFPGGSLGFAWEVIQAILTDDPWAQAKVVVRRDSAGPILRAAEAHSEQQEGEEEIGCQGTVPLAPFISAIEEVLSQDSEKE